MNRAHVAVIEYPRALRAETAAVGSSVRQLVGMHFIRVFGFCLADCVRSLLHALAIYVIE